MKAVGIYIPCEMQPPGGRGEYLYRDLLSGAQMQQPLEWSVGVFNRNTAQCFRRGSESDLVVS